VFISVGGLFGPIVNLMGPRLARTMEFTVRFTDNGGVQIAKDSDSNTIFF